MKEKLLVETLTNLRGSHRVKLVVVTDANVYKRKCPWNDIKVIQHVDGEIGYDYESAVNDEREREGLPRSFEPQERAYGKYVGDSPVVEYKGQYYLPVLISKSERSYVAEGGIFMLPPELVEPYLRKRRESSDVQETEHAVRPRDFKIKNIVVIQIDDNEAVNIEH